MNLDSLRYDTQEEFERFCKSLANRFDFLARCGFSRDKESWPVSNNFKDGFQIHFQKPGIGITVEYYDMEFDLRFEANGEQIPFYFIDKELFLNKSGFQGSMFPREKLPMAIDIVVKEMEADFRPIFEKDPIIWEAILKKYRAPETKKKKLPG